MGLAALGLLAGGLGQIGLRSGWSVRGLYVAGWCAGAGSPAGGLTGVGRQIRAAWPQRGLLCFDPYLLFGLLFCVYVLSFVFFACWISVIIRVIFTLCVLVLCRIRFIIPRIVFVTPMWPEFSFGAPFLRKFMLLGSLFMPLGSFFFPIWYSDTMQEIMLCKRIITVVSGFGPQSLVGDPVLVVYSFGIFCIFNDFVCLFHGTSLFRDLYVLLIELLSAVMDFVQFKD